MDKFTIPAFGETECKENRTNATSRAFAIAEAGEGLFNAYCGMFAENGYDKREVRSCGTHRYASLFDGERGVFINYFGAVRELYITVEDDCRYFAYYDTPTPERVSAQITQIELEDFGMCYVIRLEDGRFIVIDGGRGFEPEVDRIDRCLKSGSPHEKPIIAAWILTHPHSDHVHGFMAYMDKYGDSVTVEKFIFNFPEHDDIAHYPKLTYKDFRFEDSSAYTNIQIMHDRIARIGAPVYMAHTGQKYNIGGVVCEILACMDDTVHISDDINATSLVIRMEIAGQTILWATDAAFSLVKLPQRYGQYLKADILQIPHHGFGSGAAESEMEGYDLISPKVCLLPVSEYNAYTAFSAYKRSTDHLMTTVDVDEIIVGTPERTITLPYYAPASARAVHERKYMRGRGNAGSCTWFFSDLFTSRPEDLTFTLLNTTLATATVWIDLFFEDHHKNVRDIKYELRSSRMSKISIIGEQVDGDALYFNWMSLKELGVPEDAMFTVRFRSDIPIVVSHKEHRASYTC